MALDGSSKLNYLQFIVPTLWSERRVVLTFNSFLLLLQWNTSSQQSTLLTLNLEVNYLCELCICSVFKTIPAIANLMLVTLIARP